MSLVLPCPMAVMYGSQLLREAVREAVPLGRSGSLSPAWQSVLERPHWLCGQNRELQNGPEYDPTILLLLYMTPLSSILCIFLLLGALYVPTLLELYGSRAVQKRGA